MIDYNLQRGRGGEGSFEIGRPRSSGWKNLGRSLNSGGGVSSELDNLHGRHMCIVLNLHQEILKSLFKNISYPYSFVNHCAKKFLNKLLI